MIGERIMSYFFPSKVCMKQGADIAHLLRGTNFHSAVVGGNRSLIVTYKNEAGSLCVIVTYEEVESCRFRIRGSRDIHMHYGDLFYHTVLMGNDEYLEIMSPHECPIVRIEDATENEEHLMGIVKAFQDRVQ